MRIAPKLAYIVALVFLAPLASAQHAKLYGARISAIVNCGMSVVNQLRTLDGFAVKSVSIADLPGWATSLAFDPVNDALFTVDRVTGDLFTLNRESGESTLVGNLGIADIDVMALAYDSVNNKLYAANNRTDELVAIDPATGKGTTVGGFSLPHWSNKVVGFAFDPAIETLYGVTAASGGGVADPLLVEVNRVSGTIIPIGVLRVGANGERLLNMQALTYDKFINALIGIDGNNPPREFTIDPLTGQATNIGLVAGPNPQVYPGGAPGLMQGLAVLTNRPPLLSSIPNQPILIDGANQNPPMSSQFFIEATDPDSSDNLVLAQAGMPDYCTFSQFGGVAVMECLHDASSDPTADVQVTVTVNDNGMPNLSSSQTFTLVMTDMLNEPPVMTPIGDQSINENETLVIAFAATDSPANSLVYSLPQSPSFCSLQDNGDGTGSVTCNPDFGDYGTYPLRVKVSDDGTPWVQGSNTGSLSDSELFSLQVELATNYPPAVTPIPAQEVNVGEILQVPVASSDPDGDVLQLSTGGAPPFCDPIIDNGDGTGQLDCVPVNGDEGQYDVSVTATDDGLPVLETTVNFEMTVLPDDDSDGVSNGIDNCVGFPNAAQLDYDGDGIGDACDPSQYSDVTAFDDVTGDAVPDIAGFIGENSGTPAARCLLRRDRRCFFVDRFPQ